MCDPATYLVVAALEELRVFEEPRVFHTDAPTVNTSHFADLLARNKTVKRFFFCDSTRTYASLLGRFDREMLPLERITQRFLAFLSVVARCTSAADAESSALSRPADQDLLALVFGFAGVRRVITRK